MITTRQRNIAYIISTVLFIFGLYWEAKSKDQLGVNLASGAVIGALIVTFFYYVKPRKI